MGVFGFTYADTGKSIIHSFGYIYITKKLQKAINYKKPALKFNYVDDYGKFSVITKHKDIIEIDIYALIAAQIYIEKLYKHKLIKNYNLDMFERYINTLNRIMNGKVYNEYDFEAYTSNIRLFGIDYIDTINYAKPCPVATINLPKLGNQSAKTVKYEKVCKTAVPMLITKKKLENMIPNGIDVPINKDDDLSDIARKWGVVSGEDPSQGFSITHDNWIKYVYTKNQ